MKANKKRYDPLAKNKIVWFFPVKFLIDLFFLDRKIPKLEAPVKIKINIKIQKSILFSTIKKLFLH